MDRYSTIERAVLAALGNARVDSAGLVQIIHAAHHDIKHVAFIKPHDLTHFTIWVKYNDRGADRFNFISEIRGE